MIGSVHALFSEKLFIDRIETRERMRINNGNRYKTLAPDLQKNHQKASGREINCMPSPFQAIASRRFLLRWIPMW